MITILTIWCVCLLAFFAFCLALCRAAKQPIPGLRHPHPTILVMDDNAGVLNTVRMGLENEGYAVLTASDPREGVQLFREQSQDISLVLLDSHAHEMTGNQVFECLREIDHEVPVLLMTGFREDIETAGRLRNDVQGFLIKPFPLGDLIQKVRELVSFA